MKKHAIIISALLTLFLSYNHADPRSKTEIKVVSTVDRVMVYHDRALVTRKSFTRTLDPGIYEIIFKDLPGIIQDDSVRAKSLNSANLKIMDVEVKSYKLEKAPEERIQKLREELQNLEDRKRRTNDRILVLRTEKDFLKEAKKSFLSGRNITGKAGSVLTIQKLSVQDYQKMLAFLKTQLTENAKAIHREEINLRTINKRISIARDAMSRTGAYQSVPRKKLIRVTVEALKKGPFRMEVSYINRNISWNPGYDIRVFPKEQKTEFTGYGIVSQSSGEDWEHTKLAFSTAKPAVTGWLPDLVPLYATMSTKIPKKVGRRDTSSLQSQMAMNRALLANIDERDNLEKGEGDKLVTQTESPSKSERKLGSLVFHIKQRAEIPSDGSPHQTAIFREVFPVKFEYIAIPKLSPYAFLQAIGTNNLDLPILQGKLNIFMGNDFVGSSMTGNILPGEDFELILSVNDNIRVTRTLDEKEEKTTGFLGNTRKITYSFIIKLENYTNDKITMNLFDQIPVSKSEEVSVEVLKMSHKPVKKDKKGIMKWQFKMKPKESIDLKFSFAVMFPSNKEPAFFQTDLPPSLYIERLKNSREEYKLDDMEENQLRKKAPALRQKMY